MSASDPDGRLFVLSLEDEVTRSSAIKSSIESVAGVVRVLAEKIGPDRVIVASLEKQHWRMAVELGIALEAVTPTVGAVPIKEQTVRP